MLNTVLSKQGHAGFRTASSFSVVPLPSWRNASFLALPSIFNSAGARCHHHHHQGRYYCLSSSSCHRILLQRPLHSPSPSSETTIKGGAGAGWFSTIHDKRTSGRSFASKSESNFHNKDPRGVKANEQGERISGRRRPPQMKKQQNELLVSPSDILDEYMQKKDREKLVPAQVAAVWNSLSKAVHKSRQWNDLWSAVVVRKSEQRQEENFWIDHKASLQTLVDQTIHTADRFNGRSIATVTLSLAKLLQLTNSKSSLRGELQSLWNALLHKTMLHMQAGNFNATDIANLIWAYAKVSGGIKVDGQLLDALAKAALNDIADFSPQDLANTAWAFATLKHRAPLLFDTIARAAPVRIGDFSPQNLASTAWAFATMNHEAPLLFDAIAGAAQARIDDFNPQGLDNTSYAFAKMNHSSPLLFDTIANAAQGRIHDFRPQNLSHTACAFAKMNHSSPLLFDAIANAAQVRIHDFRPQNLSHTAWAFAKMNHKSSPLLFDAIAIAVQGRIHDFIPRALSNLSWAFATLNHDAPSLLDAIARAAEVRINKFTPQDLSTTAWAFATLNHEAPSLFDAIAQVAQVQINDFNAQEKSNMSWAFATLKHEAPFPEAGK
jgi:hypothetical protein